MKVDVLLPKNRGILIVSFMTSPWYLELVGEGDEMEAATGQVLVRVLKRLLEIAKNNAMKKFADNIAFLSLAAANSFITCHGAPKSAGTKEAMGYY